jgi:hypothetical protein
MQRSIMTKAVGFCCLVSLMGCVVAPPPPPRPVAVIPAPVLPPPVVVAPAPVVVGPGYWHWYHGRRVWVRRGRYWHHRHY